MQKLKYQWKNSSIFIYTTMGSLYKVNAVFNKLIFIVLAVLILPQISSKKSFEGDIDMSRKQLKSMQSEILFTGKIYPVHTWKNGKIPYLISPKFSGQNYKNTYFDKIYYRN